ncbi:fumarylacetoacetate hydrolase family protein [Mycolicibacterium sp. CBM1]
MRLVTYDRGQGPRPALQHRQDSELIDVATLAGIAGIEGFGDADSDIIPILALGAEGSARLRELATKHEDELRDRGALHDHESVTLCAPVLKPEKFICIGLNYHDHAAETGQPIPSEPIFFGKFANSLIGHGAAVRPPAITSQVDYEAELAVVIGKAGLNIPASKALDHVAGVMPLNDVSARDLQMANQLWTGGKAIDTFAPAGPALVLLDEIGDVQALPIKARVNGTTVQDSNTSAMIFTVADLVAYLSRIMTLVPGDIIATGTPAGVARSHGPMTFLQTGDVVEVDIDGIGLLRNPIGEPIPAPPRETVAEAAR